MIPEQVLKTLTAVYLDRGLLSTEAEPMDEFYPRLFIGSLKSAYNPRSILKYKITHIVNTCQVENAFENGIESALKYSKIKDLDRIRDIEQLKVDDIKYHRICIPDKIDTNIDDYFEQTHLFIKKALLENDARILIHCQQGISRSSTICISFLMKELNMTLDDAFEMVLQARPRIKPNRGFQQKLISYHSDLHSTLTGSQAFIKAHNTR